MVGQQAGQLARRQPVGPALVILKDQSPLLPQPVKVAVAHEMKDVVRAPAEGALQDPPGGRRQVIHLHPSLAGQRSQRRFDPPALPFGIQGHRVAGIGDQDQHPQWRRHGQRPGGAGQFQVTDDRRVMREDEVSVGAPVVEILPGQSSQFRRSDAQPEAQALVLSLCFAQAHVEARANLAADQGLEKCAAKVLHRSLLRTQRPAPAATGSEKGVP